MIRIRHFKNISLQLALIILGTVFFGHLLNTQTKAFFYSLSLSLKEGLVFILPIIIMGGMFNYMVNQKGKKYSFIGLLFILICVSNFISTMVSYGVAKVVLGKINISNPQDVMVANILLPLWTLKFYHWLSNDMALLIGLIAGGFLSRFGNQYTEKIKNVLNGFVKISLDKTFVPLLPLFVFGFIIKMQHEGSLNNLIQVYGPILAIMLSTCFMYLLFLYGLGSKFRVHILIEYLKNVLPAGILGFTTMSSMAAMPVSIKAAERNTRKELLAKAVIPATVNVHLVGDSICIPFMALAILLASNISPPTLEQYLLFSCFFVLAKFSVAAVPGGGIIVMVPILEKYLGFESSMSAFITTLYILFDPFFTTINVLGNGAFAILIAKLKLDKNYKDVF